MDYDSIAFKFCCPGVGFRLSTTEEEEVNTDFLPSPLIQMENVITAVES
jgi:hypothetical protein